ncbi:YopX family protein [Pediococcus pentosaceus]|uniref:YopX family protein n=1 Tax=Pediococcus pentosaceus TaxID=1255 RepID=UPI003F23E161
MIISVKDLVGTSDLKMTDEEIYQGLVELGYIEERGLTMIKFRAWIKTGIVTGEYVKPMTIQQMIHSKKSTFSLEQLNDLVDFEQFTGLTDVNGKEIYEGDIIQATIEGCVQDDKYLVKNMWDPHVWTEESDSYYAVSKMEVKGNVHENPELLEE